jgi:hypothetical protein
MNAETYIFHEGSIDVPDDWKDESMNIFKAPVEAGYNLVISREKIPKAINPRAHRDAQRKIIEDNLIGYKLHERRELALDNVPNEWMEYSWQSPQGPMHQVNVMRVVERSLISFTFTSSRPFTDAERELFAQMLATYKAPPAGEAN